jgi:hypothetical protein
MFALSKAADQEPAGGIGRDFRHTFRVLQVDHIVFGMKRPVPTYISYMWASAAGEGSDRYASWKDCTGRGGRAANANHSLCAAWLEDGAHRTVARGLIERAG